MKTEPSKIPEVGIVPLRCECCHGSIETNEPITPLLVDGGMSFIHTKCYENNEPKYILERMAQIKDVTKNSTDVFDAMEDIDNDA